MGRLFLLAGVFFFVFGQPHSLQAQTTVVPGCGYWKVSGCQFWDNEDWNIYFTAPSTCDFGLIQSIDLKCKNASRMTQDAVSGWVGFALHEQRYNIGANEPVNRITTFGTHNSFSSYGDGFQSFLTTDQRLSIWDQLQAGARYIRVDPDYWYGNMRVCHSSSTALCEAFSPPVGAFIGGAGGALAGTVDPEFAAVGAFAGLVEGVITPGRLYAFAIREIADWLEQNPNEVIILDLHTGQSAAGHNDLLVQPIEQFIGLDKVLIPSQQSGLSVNGFTVSADKPDVSVPLPTMNQIRAQQKQVMLISSIPIANSAGTELLTFDRTSYYTETMSKNETTWNRCQNSNGAGLWAQGTAKFGYASEDRSASVTILDASGNYGYLNEAQVATAAACGYGIIAVDFLLNKGDTSQPLAGQNIEPAPDTGGDYRREASIWSFDKEDYGSAGPAILKPNGRWSSSPKDSVHYYACKLNNLTPTNPPLPAWTISNAPATFVTASQGHNCPLGYVFGAPGTGAENSDLIAAAVAGGGIPADGLWLNYVSSFANLLNVSPTPLDFVAPAGTTPASQTVTISGLPGATVQVIQFPSISAGSAGPLLFQAPPVVTLDSNGNYNLELVPRSNIASLPAAIWISHITFIMQSTNGDGAISGTAAVTTRVDVQGRDAVTVSTTSPVVNGAVTINEGDPITLTGTITETIFNPSVLSPTGSIEFRDTLPSSSSPSPYVGFLGTGYYAIRTASLLSAATTPLSFSLAAGTHSIGANYSGDPHWEPVTSTAGLTVNVAPLIKLNPSSIALNFTAGNPVGPARSISSNVAVSATTVCGDNIGNCWITAAGSGTAFTLQYTASAASLAAGVYPATVTFSDGAHAPQTVGITLTVTGAGAITPGTLSFRTNTSSTAPPAQSITEEINGQNVAISAFHSDASWVTYSEGTDSDCTGEGAQDSGELPVGDDLRGQSGEQ